MLTVPRPERTEGSRLTWLIQIRPRLFNSTIFDVCSFSFNVGFNYGSPAPSMKVEPQNPWLRIGKGEDNYASVSGNYVNGGHYLRTARKRERRSVGPPAKPVAGTPATPIQHLVVIFQENISFDHYFGTYPNATNPQGEPPFTALPNTPSVNGIQGTLSIANPNLNPGNGAGATNPFRLDRSQAATADQDHDYTPEQLAFDSGLMDLFPANTGTAGPPPSAPPQQVLTTGLTMGYYDGNTVTALWNYAQYFAMSDNSYDTNFGPSTDGALNLISGQLNGVTQNQNGTGAIIADGNGGYTLISDADPIGTSARRLPAKCCRWADRISVICLTLPA